MAKMQSKARIRHMTDVQRQTVIEQAMSQIDIRHYSDETEHKCVASNKSNAIEVFSKAVQAALSRA